MRARVVTALTVVAAFAFLACATLLDFDRGRIPIPDAGADVDLDAIGDVGADAPADTSAPDVIPDAPDASAPDASDAPPE